MKNLQNALQLKQLYQLKALGYQYTNAKLFVQQETPLELPNTIVDLKKQQIGFFYAVALRSSLESVADKITLLLKKCLAQ